MTLIGIGPRTDPHMPDWTIYADELHEGDWFRNLHPRLADAREDEITGAVARNPLLGQVLAYDRPDVILTDASDCPVLVIERTVEVPSGHNVGQRFARLAAAGEARVPVVYFGPYAAYKHGGATSGPRYMNLRLFSALDQVAAVNNSAVTCINWPVDENYEIVRAPTKDARMRDYLDLFFAAYDDRRSVDVNEAIRSSQFESEQRSERQRFAETLKRATVYDSPPKSVEIVTGVATAAAMKAPALERYREVVVYRVGARYVRSDPYTGMAMLYRYLYVLGMSSKRGLMLDFPHITTELWQSAAASRSRKDVRLFRIAADAVRFADSGVLERGAF
jgi:hypothetical protein